MSPLPPLLETVLTASPNGSITAYDPYTGTVLARFSGTHCPPNAIILLGNNQFACSNVSPETGAGSIHLYYWWSPSCSRHIPLPEPVAPLASTPDGSYLFSGGISGQIHSIMVHSGDLIRSISAHKKPISCIAVSSDGPLILSGSDDGTIVVTPILMLLDHSSIDMNFFNIMRFSGHDLAVTGLTTGMGRSDNIMISSSLDWTCKVWSMVTGAHLHTVNFPVEIWCVVLDPVETELYAAAADGVIYKKALKVDTRKRMTNEVETFAWGGLHDDGVIVGMVMLNYGSALLTVCENGGVNVWDVGSGKLISSFVENSGGVSGVVVVKRDGGFGTREVENAESSCYGGDKMTGEAVKEAVEMKEAMKVVVEERGRAISELDSAIEINEKLLNLMLIEANAISKYDDLKQKMSCGSYVLRDSIG